MGASASKSNSKYKFTNTGEPKLESVTFDDDFDRRWEVFIQSLDVGPENVRQIEQLEPDQKKELLLNFESKNPNGSASQYVNQIKNLKPGKLTGKSFECKNGRQTVQILSATEVSLRTNDVKWVYEFLNNNGLEILLDYMSRSLVLFLNRNFKCIGMKYGTRLKSENFNRLHSINLLSFRNSKTQNSNNRARDTTSRKSSIFRRLNQASISINENVKISLHQSLKCIRAILNNQRGCEMVFEHIRAIDIVTLCLLHPSYQTKTLVLETLAAVCLIENGLQKTLSAFDYFREVTGETRRFETLISFFKEHETFKVDDYNIDFMVACMQFINIIVHSGEDINLRVYLQQEFHLLGLDDFYKKLEEKCGERLLRQLRAYSDNYVDVGLLLEDAEQKEQYMQEAERMEKQLYAMEEQFQNRMVQLDNRINELRVENDTLRTQKDEQQNEFMTLKSQLNSQGTVGSSGGALTSQQIEHFNNYIFMLTNLLQKHDLKFAPMDPLPVNINQSGSAPIAAPPAPPGPPVPPPVPPPVAPPPPSFGVPPAAPPPPGGLGPVKLGAAVTNTQATPIRPPIQTKFKLPILNWSVLKNQQLKGTIFVTMNDELLYDRLDFNNFEETFRLNSGPAIDGISNGGYGSAVDGSGKNNGKKKSPKKSLLDNNRHRCLGVLLKFLDQVKLTPNVLLEKIAEFDITTDVADRILYQLPSSDDVRMYRKYEYSDKQPVNSLSDEDRLLMSLCKVERLQQRLEILVFMETFRDSYLELSEKVTVVTRASLAVRNSSKLKQIMEIILAYGNLMNSSRRGIMYGFKLQSLDLLVETRNLDKSVNILQFIVQIIDKKFPELIGFLEEMKFVDPASRVPMEALTVDVSMLAENMKKVKEEISQNHKIPNRVKEFFSENDGKVSELIKNAQNAKQTFLEAAEWLGERQNNPKPDEFFGIFNRFIDNFKKCYTELVKRRKANVLPVNTEEANKTPQQKPKEKKLAQEARKKNRRNINRTRQINGDGIMDEILAVLEDSPLQAEIHPRRSRWLEDGVV